MVVLPAPFEPSSASTSPARDRRATRRTAPGTGRSPRRRRAARAAATGSTAALDSRRVDAGRRHEVSRGTPGAPRVVGEHLVRSGPRAISVPKSSTKTPLHEAAHELDVVLDEQDRGAALALHVAQRRRRARRSRRGRDPTTARRAAAAAARSSAPGRSRRAGPGRGSATRPGGRRRGRGRAGRASRRRASSSSAVGRPETSRSFQSAPVAAARPGRRRGSARAASCRRRARCAGTCGRCRAAARRWVGSAVRSRPSNVDPAAVGPQDAEQAVEERRLPGAVRTDEADDLARRRRRALTSSSAVMPANRFVMSLASSRSVMTSARSRSSSAAAPAPARSLRAA